MLYLLFTLFFCLFSDVSAIRNATLNHGLEPTEIHEQHRFALGMMVVGILVVGFLAWFAWYRSRRSNYEAVSTEATA